MNACHIAAEHAQDPTWQRAWAIECEARLLLSLPLETRRTELAHPSRRFRRQDLEEEMTRQFKEQRREP